MNKIISRVISDAKKDQRIIGAQIRLKKNGQYSSVNGKIVDIKVNKDGEPYVLMENYLADRRKDGRQWQAFSLKNVIKVFKDGEIYS